MKYIVGSLNTKLDRYRILRALRFSDKSLEIVSFDLSAFYFVALYLSRCINAFRSRTKPGQTMICKYTHIVEIQCLLQRKRRKNRLFIHNSMQFHTFFPCGAIPIIDFFHFVSFLLFFFLFFFFIFTRIIARIHVCLYGHVLNVIIFQHIQQRSPIIIHRKEFAFVCGEHRDYCSARQVKLCLVGSNTIFMPNLGRQRNTLSLRSLILLVINFIDFGAITERTLRSLICMMI